MLDVLMVFAFFMFLIAFYGFMQEFQSQSQKQIELLEQILETLKVSRE